MRHLSSPPFNRRGHGYRKARGTEMFKPRYAITEGQNQGRPAGVALQSHGPHGLPVCDLDGIGNTTAPWLFSCQPSCSSEGRASTVGCHCGPLHTTDPCCRRSRMVQPPHFAFYFVCVCNTLVSYLSFSPDKKKLFPIPLLSHLVLSFGPPLPIPDFPFSGCSLHCPFPGLCVFSICLHVPSSHTQVSRQSC